MTMINPLLQACFKLMGYGDPNESLLFVSDLINEHELKQSHENHDRITYLFCLYLKLHIAVYLNELDYARNELASELKKRDFGVVIPYLFKFKMFFEGLAETANAKKSLFSLLRAKNRLKYMRKSALLCPENNINKVYLLEAELASSAGRYDQAVLKFDRAIKYAHKEGYISEEALAWEKAARLHLSFGKLAEAGRYFSSAVNLYEKWGAKRKTDQLRTLCENEKISLPDKNI